jgi:hypothetical protein
LKSAQTLHVSKRLNVQSFALVRLTVRQVDDFAGTKRLGEGDASVNRRKKKICKKLFSVCRKINACVKTFYCEERNAHLKCDAKLTRLIAGYVM